MFFFIFLLGIYYFQISLLQTPPAPPAPSGPLAPPSSSSPTWEAQTYILEVIPDFGRFRLEQQHLEQKLRVFVSSELLWALELYKTLVPFSCSSKDKKNVLGSHQLGTLGRVGQRVDMSVCVSDVPFPCNFFRGLLLALRSHDQIQASHWPSGHMIRSRPCIGWPPPPPLPRPWTGAISISISSRALKARRCSGARVEP